MTPDERDLTPEEEAVVSALLADAGGPVTIPPEVVARLDDVLAGLVAERAAGHDGDQETAARTTVPEDTGAGGPVSSDAERRRRRWPRALLAAAAVVAGGYGVGAALTGTSMSGDGEAESAVSADESAGGSSDAGGSDAGGAGNGQALESAPERDAVGRRPAEAPANGSSFRQGAPRLRSDHLAEDVVRLLDRSGRQPARDDAAVSKRALLGAAAACLPPELDRNETWYLVRYDGLRAALVTTPPTQGTVEATVVRCDGEPLDAVTVPAE